MTHMLHVMDIAETIQAEDVALGAVQIDFVHSFSGRTARYSILAGSRGQNVHRGSVDTQQSHHQCHTLLHGGAVLVLPDTATKLDAPWKLVYMSFKSHKPLSSPDWLVAPD